MILAKLPTDLIDDIDRLRQDLHMHPELCFQEKRTAALVVGELRRHGVDEVAEGVGGTGVVGLLSGSRPGKTVALRADMDALPIREETGLPYASRNPGLMHACGHDGHTAVLLGVARLLAEQRQLLPGRVKFIFQPAEEEGAGAQRLVQAGVLRDPPVEAIFALHARPEIQAGQIELDPLPNAACDAIDLRVIGQGTHGAYPHLGVDALAVACQLVSSLQLVVSREVAPFQEAVVTIGSLHAGSRRNIIAAEAQLQGTIRTRDPEVRKLVIAAVRRIAVNTATAFGARAEVVLGEHTPRVRNNDGLLHLVRQVGAGVLGEAQVLEASERSMGGEDFAFYLEEQGGVPGCIFRLGVECNAPLHSPTFDFGRKALEPGMLLLANLALRFLGAEGERP